jgi:Tfp pilus assembly protein PilN
VTFKRGESLSIKGISSEMPKVFEFVTHLENSAFFHQPEARRVAKRQVEGKDVTGFEIVSELGAS